MGQTLTHGIYLPDEGERNCYDGLAGNWTILDGAVGTIAEHTSQIAGKAPLVHTHTKSDVTDLLNSNFIPSANNSYDLGSSSYQWNNLYAKNYYYNGVVWGLDKANVWSDNNIFNKNVGPASVTSVTDTTLAFNGLFNTIFLNTRGSSNRRSYGSFLFAGYGTASGVDNYGQIQLLRSTDKRGDTDEGYIPDTSFKMWRVAPHSLIMDSMEAVRVTNDGTENSLKPITNNATDLGTSDNKWKTLNGINPGALSLPKIVTKNTANIASAIVGADGETQYLDGTDNNYTAALDGWISMCISGFTQSNELWITVYDQNNETWGTSAESSTSARNNLFIIFPIRANQKMRIRMRCNSVVYARFYPCEGNV